MRLLLCLAVSLFITTGCGDTTVESYPPPTTDTDLPTSSPGSRPIPNPGPAIPNTPGEDPVDPAPPGGGYAAGTNGAQGQSAAESVAGTSVGTMP